MIREIKFRAFGKADKQMHYFNITDAQSEWISPDQEIHDIQQYTCVKDKDGDLIFEGDILEFSDKWEWYKSSYGIKMRFAEPERLAELQEMYDKEPMERRVIEMPECYEWLLSSEIQTYWKIIGNIYQSPELLKP